MVTIQPLIVGSQALYDLIVQPQFADYAEGFTGNYNGTLNEFTTADLVSLGKGTPIIDIFGKKNILQRKDASCKTNWNSIAKGSTRRLTVDELYGAVEDCQEEFYTGCMKDFREQNPRFREIVLGQFKKAIGSDIASNSYFGDVARPQLATDEWSLNKFDGIFTKYAQYTAGSNTAYKPVILSAIPGGAITPAQAYALFQSAYDAQTPVMRTQLSTDMGFFVSQDLATALQRYYIGVGYNTSVSSESVNFLMNGLPQLKFQGIPVFVEPTWQPILNTLNATNAATAHALILTIRKNFVFGTNKTYGGGPELNQGMMVWFDWTNEVWKYKMWLTAGTDLASPQNTVMAITTLP